jgi:hypothetical protein
MPSPVPIELVVVVVNKRSYKGRKEQRKEGRNKGRKE